VFSNIAEQPHDVNNDNPPEQTGEIIFENDRHLPGLDMDVWLSLEEDSRREIPSDPNERLVGIWVNNNVEYTFFPDRTGIKVNRHTNESIEFTWVRDSGSLTITGEGINFQGGALILDYGVGTESAHMHLQDFQTWTSESFQRFRPPSDFLFTDWNRSVVMFDLPGHSITSSVPDLLAFITNGARTTSSGNTNRIGANLSYPALLTINYGTTIDVKDQELLDRVREYGNFLRLLGWEVGVILADPRDVTTSDLNVLVKDGIFVALVIFGGDDTGLVPGTVALDIGPYPFSRSPSSNTGSSPNTGGNQTSPPQPPPPPPPPPQPPQQANVLELLYDGLVNYAFNDLQIFWDNGTTTSFYSEYDADRSYIYWDMHSRDGNIREVFPTFALGVNAVIIGFPQTTTRLYYMYDNGRGEFGDETFSWSYQTRHGEIQLFQ
jgi:hypothetical protein